MVMGIMGKTQGVKMAARPTPNATSRKAPKPCVSCAALGGAPPALNPAGIAGAAACAAGSMVRAALAVNRRGGMHTLSLQVW